MEGKLYKTGKLTGRWTKRVFHVNPDTGALHQGQRADHRTAASKVACLPSEAVGLTTFNGRRSLHIVRAGQQDGRYLASADEGVPMEAWLAAMHEGDARRRSRDAGAVPPAPAPAGAAATELAGATLDMHTLGEAQTTLARGAESFRARRAVSGAGTDRTTGATAGAGGADANAAHGGAGAGAAPPAGAAASGAPAPASRVQLITHRVQDVTDTMAEALETQLHNSAVVDRVVEQSEALRRRAAVFERSASHAKRTAEDEARTGCCGQVLREVAELHDIFSVCFVNDDDPYTCRRRSVFLVLAVMATVGMGLFVTVVANASQETYAQCRSWLAAGTCGSEAGGTLGGVGNASASLPCTHSGCCCADFVACAACTGPSDACATAVSFPATRAPGLGGAADVCLDARCAQFVTSCSTWGVVAAALRIDDAEAAVLAAVLTAAVVTPIKLGARLTYTLLLPAPLPATVLSMAALPATTMGERGAERRAAVRALRKWHCRTCAAWAVLLPLVLLGFAAFSLGEWEESDAEGTATAVEVSKNAALGLLVNQLADALLLLVAYFVLVLRCGARDTRAVALRKLEREAADIMAGVEPEDPWVVCIRRCCRRRTHEVAGDGGVEGSRRRGMGIGIGASSGSRGGKGKPGGHDAGLGGQRRHAPRDTVNPVVLQLQELERAGGTVSGAAIGDDPGPWGGARGAAGGGGGGDSGGKGAKHVLA